MPNIAIVWDFDNTLSPEDSTSKTVDVLMGRDKHKEFWRFIESVTQEEKLEWEHVLAAHAPAWMYALSRIASQKRIPLNKEFFREYVVPQVKLYKNVIEFLKTIKALEKKAAFKQLDLKIHHFIVSAGLKELVEQVFPENLITYTFGCRYEIIADLKFPDEPESIPVFCMDETMKTRSLFEISKGSFGDPKKPVNKRVSKEDRFVLFSDMIYIGDGPTDIPALSLTRYNGGLGVVVYDKDRPVNQVQKRLKEMSLDKRADLITKADYSLKGELFKFIEARCIQICQRYAAENMN